MTMSPHQREKKRACDRARYERDPAKKLQQLKEYREREGMKLKIRAWRMVLYERQHGRMVKPALCERCGNPGQIDGHHEDYSKPLEVEWLCRSCHVLEHARAT